jgi:micrococcal nuclease
VEREKKILIRAAALLAAALAMWLVDRLAPPEPPVEAEPASVQTAAASSSASACAVAKIVDGDTLRVACPDAAEEPVRLVGVDAPEVARQGDAAECGAAEATDALGAVLGDGPVYLARDPEQDDRDRYGRLLRFVSTSSPASADEPWAGSVNLALVRDGAAGAYGSLRYGGKGEFRAAEAAARAAGLGLWERCAEVR